MTRTPRRPKKAFTLLELLIYTAVVGIAVTMFSKYMTDFAKTAKGSEDKMLRSADLRRGLIRVEEDLYEANEILSVSPTSITFICDMLKAPSWDMNGDFDGDGIPNIKDTDSDNDAQTKFTMPKDLQWRTGYDLEDDDDDNDGKLDVRITLYLSSGTLYRGVSVNEAPYSVSPLAASISSFSFTCYGSKREDLGKNIDLGDDGTSGTGDTGEGDGVISEREMDWVPPPAGNGDRSGAVDTPEELKYVTSIAVHMEEDSGSGGQPEAQLDTEISPPLLPLKRRR